MSLYTTIQGKIAYQTEESFQKSLKILTDGGWLDGVFIIDECGEDISKNPNIDTKEKTIEIPLGLHRNLSYVLDQLFSGGIGKVVWASSDGCFEGGVIENGIETLYDLQEYSLKEGTEADIPNFNDDFDKYCQWQSEVEQDFFEEFADFE